MIKKLFTNKWIQIVMAMVVAGAGTYFGINSDNSVSIKPGIKIDTVYIETKMKIDTTKVLEFTDNLDEFSIATLGEIRFSDSSNKFTNVDIIVPFPYGKSQITYTDKYVPKNFRKYLGMGMSGKTLTLSGDLYYKKVGIGVVINQGETGIYLKYEFFLLLPAEEPFP